VRSCSDVHNYLMEQDVPHEVLHLPALARTARAASELLAVPLADVVKTLVFLLDDKPTLVLIAGDQVADAKRLAAVTGALEVAQVRGKQVFDITGYRAGAVPPCGLATTLPAIADARIFLRDVVYCGGGATATMLKLRSSDLRHLLRPAVADIATMKTERT